MSPQSKAIVCCGSRLGPCFVLRKKSVEVCKAEMHRRSLHLCLFTSLAAEVCHSISDAFVTNYGLPERKTSRNLMCLCSLLNCVCLYKKKASVYLHLPFVLYYNVGCCVPVFVALQSQQCCSSQAASMPENSSLLFIFRFLFEFRAVCEHLSFLMFTSMYGAIFFTPRCSHQPLRP